jgi:hypothetical protein
MHTMHRFISRRAVPLLLTMTAISAISCVRSDVLDVGPVFVTSDANDIDMHRTKRGFLILDPNKPGTFLRTVKDGRWISDKFMTYLIERAAKSKP